MRNSQFLPSLTNVTQSASLHTAGRIESPRYQLLTTVSPGSPTHRCVLSFAPRTMENNLNAAPDRLALEATASLQKRRNNAAAQPGSAPWYTQATACLLYFTLCRQAVRWRRYHCDSLTCQMRVCVLLFLRGLWKPPDTGDWHPLSRHGAGTGPEAPAATACVSPSRPGTVALLCPAGSWSRARTPVSH